MEWIYREVFGALKQQLPKLLELELELIQTQMTQKPMLRAEVHAHAMRASQNIKRKCAGGEEFRTPIPPLKRKLFTKYVV